MSLHMPENGMDWARVLQIDPEFSRLVPPLSRDERLGLKADLLNRGCIDALHVWQGMNLILDGQNRFEICREAGLPFRVLLVDLADRTYARAYIVRWQLRRRNISQEATAYLRGSRYALEKNSHGGDRRSAKASAHREHLKVAERLSAEYHISPATIRRDEKLARAVDGIVANCGEGSKSLVLSRDTGLSHGQILTLSKRTPEEQRQYLAELERSGKRPRRRPGADGGLTITLPRATDPLVDTLVERLGREGAERVWTRLGERLAAS